MTRTAEASIKGYVYQFILCLKELLNAQDGASVTMEGPIEDVDISSTNGYKAIQCKYHEASTSFTTSKIYKPIL